LVVEVEVVAALVVAAQAPGLDLAGVVVADLVLAPGLVVAVLSLDQLLVLMTAPRP
jgi:hypothetical protein